MSSTVTPNAADAAFPPLPAERAPHELELELLARWRDERLFERVQEARAGGEPFVFYEGPPTANGRPGIHHVFARTIKDLFCRHRAMRNHFVPRKAGWDTHGLPVEIEVEKSLGISGKPEIEKFGVAEFNRLCRESVFKYRGEWEELSERMAYWLDYERAYVTYHKEYVESVWWALKTLADKGLLFRGHKILPYCPRCGTALSSHELALGYKVVTDPSVYVALDLEHDGPERRRILVWTTTPWTLVSNTALAVNPELTYVELRKRTGAQWTIVLAQDLAGAVLGADWADRWDVVQAMPGTALVGMRYRRPLDWVEFPEAGERQVIVGESFVTAQDGTGVVHIAPAFGVDDYEAGKRHGLAFVQPVNARGEFDASVPVVGGVFFKKADPLIVEELKRRDVLWKAAEFEHDYPHCWRCGTVLIYSARDSWFVRTTAYRDSMVARSAAMNWNPPEVGSGRFGSWLENNIDWAVSRDRYWGSPLPVWVNDADPSEIQVVGSYAELAERLGRPLPDDFDPHKPQVDEYTWPAPSGTGTMRRVPQVIDAWFDSGSMPFAQWHYPFENREMVARQFPADFIAEGVDQTRGWFYSLLAIATGLGDALPNNAGDAPAPYRAVVVNDLVLDAAGQKMSKSRGNVVNPWEIMERHGADAARLFLVSSSQVWVPRRFDEAAIRQTAGNFLVTLKNVYRFLSLYANFGWAPSDADPAPADRPALDRWVLSRLAGVEREADRLLGDYDATSAARRVMEFFDDDVSKWYVRLSRARFWFPGSEPTADARAAFATLHEVLAVTCRLLAPFAPFVTDWMHRALTGASVHLAAYARPNTTGAEDEALEAAMDDVRRLANLGRAAREAVGINVRQPLAEVVGVLPVRPGQPQPPRALLEELSALLRTELNVKAVRWAESGDALVTLEAKPNFRVLGKRFGKATPLAAQAVGALGSEALQAFERGEPVTIAVEGAEHPLLPEDLAIHRRATGEYAVQEEGGLVAALDPRLTPELKQEGMARELVSRVQRLRKEAGLEVSDRIVLAVTGAPEVEAAVRAHEAYVAGEVLATSVRVGAGAADAIHPSNRQTQAFDLDGSAVHVTLSKDHP
ncbi:isoleucine--tRNA ligase [Roseisolibacter sp. H3M3-2]|uniref:isoleucine--tRNA ligase n=1 Tax=Roseisolibacter sp. H3M3-2 TaxID=3031323 RepID=UPI0023DA6C1E|nr:isoleucine--tRNA ligase [Roseisolibacter sp. H3M3-2]MDF1504401.1 isoleucine--tRNA ligase [Roseisolibacter sp. H3M3-2]